MEAGVAVVVEWNGDWQNTSSVKAHRQKEAGLPAVCRYFQSYSKCEGTTISLVLTAAGTEANAYAEISKSWFRPFCCAVKHSGKMSMGRPASILHPSRF